MTNHKQIVLDYVTQNKDVLKELMNEHIVTRDNLLVTEPFIFHEEIKLQFKGICDWLIANEISKHGSLTVEDCMIVLIDVGIENIYPEIFTKET